jgi:hypothetical protein
MRRILHTMMFVGAVPVLVGPSVRSSDSAHRAEKVQGPAPFYVGVSDDKSGWLIRLDPSGSRGLIVGPIGVLPLCSVSLAQGRVSFLVPPTASIAYAFDGRGDASRLDGTVAKRGAVDGNAKWSRRLKMRAAGGSTALRGDSRVEGVYATSPEGMADGPALVLLGDHDSTLALYVERQGSQGRSSPPSRITLVGDTLRFAWHKRDLRAVAGFDTIAVNGQALARIGSLDEVLSRVAGRCP